MKLNPSIRALRESEPQPLPDGLGSLESGIERNGFVALGSNLGDRADQLRRAVALLDRTPGIRVVAVSSFHETAPVGDPNQPAYLNAAAWLATTLAPRELLDALLAVERQLGRLRRPEARWAARTIDLDLLLMDDLILDEPGLTLPHPRLHERAFVLEPLAEIASEVIHPVLHRSIRQLRDDLRAASRRTASLPEHG